MRTLRLGTAVKITTALDVPTVTSATITIENPSETDMVTDAVMTKEADNVYSYVYQSATTDVAGTYEATITVVYNTYTSISKEEFILVE